MDAVKHLVTTELLKKYETIIQYTERPYIIRRILSADNFDVDHRLRVERDALPRLTRLAATVANCDPIAVVGRHFHVEAVPTIVAIPQEQSARVRGKRERSVKLHVENSCLLPK